MSGPSKRVRDADDGIVAECYGVARRLARRFPHRELDEIVSELWMLPTARVEWHLKSG